MIHKDKSTGRFASQPLRKRFFSKVEKKPNDCWEWVGSKLKSGYGKMRDTDQKTRPATHISWFLKTGEYPTLFMCHKCDNPSCVNPGHLFEGTHTDNMRDAVKKKRTVSGDKSHFAILKADQVVKIKQSLEKGCTLTSLGLEYGVHYSTIGKIKSGDNWKHI